MENLDSKIVNKILEFLDKQEIGATTQETAKETQHNRTTVAKYLEVMRSSKLVDVKTIGQAKLWSRTADQNRSKILVVDDDPNIRELVKLSLSNSNYTFIEASNGIEALQKAKAEQPNLIVLDLMMPHMDGIEACTLIKKDERTKDIPVIMLTAKSADMDKVKGLKCGANDYITKPFYPLELEARVESVLRQQNEILEKSVTGLPTFSTFFTKAASTEGNMFFVKIEAFNDFIQTYGMKQGKDLLEIISRLLKKATTDHGTPEDFCAHLNEGEFALVTYGNYHKMIELVKNQFEAMSKTGDENDAVLSLTVSKIDSLTIPESVFAEEDVEKIKAMAKPYQPPAPEDEGSD